MSAARSARRLCLYGGLVVGLSGSALAQDPTPQQRLRLATAEAKVGAADSVAREIQHLGNAKLSLRERHAMARKALKLADLAAIRAQPGAVLDVCRAVALAFPHTESAPKAYLLAAKTLRERLGDPRGASQTARCVLAIPPKAGFVAKTAYRRARGDALSELGACHLAQGQPLGAIQACLDGLGPTSALWAFTPAPPLLQASRALAQCRFVTATQVVDAVTATPQRPVERAGRVTSYRRTARAFLDRLAQVLARDGRNGASTTLRGAVDPRAQPPALSAAPPAAWSADDRALARELEQMRADHAHRLPGWRARATAGDAEAMLALGGALAKGLAVVRDTTAAERWIERAADAGLAEACLERYRQLKRVQGRRYDPTVEGPLLTRAIRARTGPLDLWFHLRRSESLRGLDAAALRRGLRPLAAKGDVWAQLCLGAIAFRSGQPDRARAHLLRAGQLGQADEALPLLLKLCQDPNERLVLIRGAKLLSVLGAPSLRSLGHRPLARLRQRLAAAGARHPLAQDELSRLLAAGLGGARNRPAAGKAHYASLLARDLRAGYVAVEQPLLLEASTRSALIADVRKGDPRALHLHAACLQGTWDLGDVTKIIPLHREDARRRGVAPCRGTLPDWGLYLEAEATLNAELAWARQHAARGDRWAIAYLGYLSQQLLNDDAAALRLLQSAAKLGSAWAAATLIHHSDAQRSVWVRRAAELGDRDAMRRLAAEARRAKRPAEAKRWRQAALAAGAPETLRGEAARQIQAGKPAQAAAVLRRLSKQGDRKGYVALQLLLLEHPKLRTPTDP